MKVVLISNSDTNGGAAVVTRRLMSALRGAGADARMLVYSKLSADPNIMQVGTRSARSLMFMKERMGIMRSTGFNRENIFKVSTADSGINLTSHPWIQEADVILLGWVNQGLLSLKGIKRLAEMGKPLVWVMHDMWNMTGICHHAMECDHYKGECGRCPYLHSDNPRDLSHRTWCRKQLLYDTTNIHFVAVSRWLARKCAESSLLKDRDVSVIPNAFPIEAFSTRTQQELKVSALDYSKKIILMGAARLDHPIKGLDYAIDALNEIFTKRPDIAASSTAVFFGDVRDASVFDRLNFPSLHLGTISDAKVLRELYAAARVVLSTSLYETLPGTLIEGQAAGAIPVTFDHGGQTDIVDHLKSGYIAKYKDAKSVAEGILWALDADIDPEALHAQVAERFSAKQVALQFLRLFDRLLKEK